MTIHKALRGKAAINKIIKQKNPVEVGLGILTLASLFMTAKNTKPKNSKKWGHKGY